MISLISPQPGSGDQQPIGHPTHACFLTDDISAVFGQWCERGVSVLGLSEQWACEIGECELSAGDTLAIYTDGVTEAFNEAGEEFGEERLAEALARHRTLPAQHLSEAIRNEIHQFNPHHQSGDITLVIATCK